MDLRGQSLPKIDRKTAGAGGRAGPHGPQDSGDAFLRPLLGRPDEMWWEMREKGEMPIAAQQMEGSYEACWPQTRVTQKPRTTAFTSATEEHWSPEEPTKGIEPQTGVSS